MQRVPTANKDFCCDSFAYPPQERSGWPESVRLTCRRDRDIVGYHHGRVLRISAVPISRGHNRERTGLRKMKSASMTDRGAQDSNRRRWTAADGPLAKGEKGKFE